MLHYMFMTHATLYNTCHVLCSSLGLEDGDGRQCLLTRLESSGLVADLRKFNKPGKRDVSGKYPTKYFQLMLL